jgi:hypothetical protein
MASLTQTTLAAAVTAGATSITVASASNIKNPTGGFYQKIYVIDPNQMKGELMTVLSFSGVQVQVSRLDAFKGPHLSGSIVVIADVDPLGARFYECNPIGSPATDPGFTTPYINVVTGEQWLYSSLSGGWVAGWNNPAAKGVTAALASGDTAAPTPSGPLFHMTGTSAVTSITIPVGFAGGSFTVISDAAWTWTLTNNIGCAGTAVAHEVVTFWYDSATAFFYASHLAA